MARHRPERRRPLRLALASGWAAVMVTVPAGCTPGRPGAARPDRREPSTSVPEPAPAGGGAQIIMVIRHAEKPTKRPAAAGVNADGEPDSGSLTVRGWQRAGALATLLDPPQPEPVRAGLARPTAVYVMKPGDDTRRRPAETVAPLAARLGLTVDDRYRRNDTAALARDVTAHPGTVLVCWQHEKIPAIARQLGAVSPPAPERWPDDRYDLIWVFTRDGAGWRFSQVPQLLLAGDSDRPVS